MTDTDFWNKIAAKYAARPVDDPAAYEALDRLFASQNDSERLADVLERRMEVEPEVEARVEVGDPARLTLDAYGDMTFSGKVRRVGAYVLDLDPARVNTEMVELTALGEDDVTVVRDLVARHRDETDSAVAAAGSPP